MSTHCSAYSLFLLVLNVILSVTFSHQSNAQQPLIGWKKVRMADLAYIDSDIDQDGILDSREQALGTNPRSPDTDGDTLSDFDEVMNRQFGYDPSQYTDDRDFDGYQAFGTSDDWLYKNNGILAITVESYSRAEADGGGSDFFPETREIQKQVVKNNLNGAMNFITACRSLDLSLPSSGVD